MSFCIESIHGHRGIYFISVANGLKTDSIRSGSHTPTAKPCYSLLPYTENTHMIRFLLSRKIAYLVQKKRGHGLINFPLLVISPSLGTAHVSVADAARPSVEPEAEPPGCPQNYQRGRKDHQVLHGCSDGCEIHWLPRSRAIIWITGFSITISNTIFVSWSNTHRRART